MGILLTFGGGDSSQLVLTLGHIYTSTSTCMHVRVFIYKYIYIK